MAWVRMVALSKAGGFMLDRPGKIGSECCRAAGYVALYSLNYLKDISWPFAAISRSGTASRRTGGQGQDFPAAFFEEVIEAYGNAPRCLVSQGNIP